MQPMRFFADDACVDNLSKYSMIAVANLRFKILVFLRTFKGTIQSMAESVLQESGDRGTELKLIEKEPASVSLLPC